MKESLGADPVVNAHDPFVNTGVDFVNKRVDNDTSR
jgi:hypothetical protein